MPQMTSDSISLAVHIGVCESLLSDDGLRWLVWAGSGTQLALVFVNYDASDEDSIASRIVASKSAACVSPTRISSQVTNQIVSDAVLELSTVDAVYRPLTQPMQLTWTDDHRPRLRPDQFANELAELRSVCSRAELGSGSVLEQLLSLPRWPVEDITVVEKLPGGRDRVFRCMKGGKTHVYKGMGLHKLLESGPATIERELSGLHQEAKTLMGLGRTDFTIQPLSEITLDMKQGVICGYIYPWISGGDVDTAITEDDEAIAEDNAHAIGLSAESLEKALTRGFFNCDIKPPEPPPTCGK